MKMYDCYVVEDGEIIAAYSFSDPEAITNLKKHHKDVRLGKADPEKQYIHNNRLTNRIEIPVSLVGYELFNVPKGTQIIINDEHYVSEEGGKVTLEFDQPGHYIVRLLCEPYLSKEFYIAH